MPRYKPRNIFDDYEEEPETTGANPPEQLNRHPNFFFSNDLVAIQVENTLFNVHRFQLAKSENTWGKLRQAIEEEGSSPEQPIKLEGVSVSDFAALLKVLYNSPFPSNQPSPETSLIIAAFRMADKFRFSGLRAYLLTLAEKELNDIDKIVFATEFYIKELLTPPYIRLCERAEPLNSEEIRKLGAESVSIISRLREQHRNRTVSFTVGYYYCYSCTGMKFENANDRNGDRECDGCGTEIYSSGLSYTGSEKRTQTVIVDSSAIEMGVKKWVEDRFPEEEY
ncbi:unnamed protein product [Rhizoctonia solani]|uniref:BTB domain-containing protein n=1 Tax=Rhizoctonia solani TaxID=456999 RepID=A0A8H3EDY8_9AGAM|nr:unnamed protein product [Rhizoctonia solani]